MDFKVTEKEWLAVESARVKGIILMPKFWGVKWSQTKLQEELAKIGLSYTKEEIDKLSDALHTAVIVEDIEGADEPTEPLRGSAEPVS